jgi:hypothetical protein
VLRLAPARNSRALGSLRTAGRVAQVTWHHGDASGGGARGRVCRWSPASRRRLLFVSGSIDWESLRKEWGGDWLFMTLTYRLDPGAERAKRDLDVLGRRWAREWGACLWAAWSEIAGDGDRLRVDADYARANDMVRYFVAYASTGRKAYQHIVPPTWAESTGRWWGKRGLPIHWEEHELRRADYVRIRRLLLRYRQSRSRRRLSAPHGMNGCWVLGQRSHSLRDAIHRVLQDGSGSRTSSSGGPAP